MTELLCVFLGGGLGAVIRYLMSNALNPIVIAPYLSGIPLGTLVVNWMGSLLLGILMGLFPLTTPLKLALTTGLMGGLTTFSTFSVEGIHLLSNGGFLKMSLHIGLHVGGGLILAMLGLSLGLSYAKCG